MHNYFSNFSIFDQLDIQKFEFGSQRKRQKNSNRKKMKESAKEIPGYFPIFPTYPWVFARGTLLDETKQTSDSCSLISNTLRTISLLRMGKYMLNGAIMWGIV